MGLALLRYWHCEDKVAGKPRKKLFPNTKAEVLHVSLAFLQPWRYYMCDEVGFIPDSKIPQMWVHWDLKPCCVLIVSVALAVSTPVSLQTYGDLCECDITYFTLISLYRLILFSWAPLDKARFSSFLQYFCYSQSKHGNLIIPEGEWKQASIDILVSKTKDRRKTRSERSWRSARLSPDGWQLWACAGLSSCPAGSYRCIYCIKHRFSIALDYYLHRGMALGWAMPRNRMAIASKPGSHIDSRLRISKYT